MTIQEAIVQVAKSYVGKKEKPSNTGFLDATFEAEMKVVGWQSGWAWCSLFTELVWRKAYQQVSDPHTVDSVGALFSPMAVDTATRFKRAGYIIYETPKVGDLVIWKHGHGPSGHAGIVIGVGPDKAFSTVEGNTNAAGSREGDTVAIKARKIGMPFQVKGLNLIGFIRPD